MLSALHIRNYVLIDSLDIDFPEGLVIITGQTGAGKSILLGALGLLLGARADASVIGENSDKCIVEAEFEADGFLRAIIEEQDVDWDSGHLVIRRVVNDSGRSRCFVNDCPVNIQLLQDIASRLVDIHSQHSNLLLKDRAWQLKLLDHFASCDALRAETADVWQQMRRLESELRKDRERLESLSADREYNEERMRRLESACLREGELEELEEEHRSLTHAEEIKQHIETVLSLRDSEDLSLPSRLRDAVKSLSKAAAYIPSLESLGQRLDSARIEIDDILDEASACGDKVSLSRERLEEVESRLSLLYDLLKRYSCSSVGELMEKKEKYSVSVGGIAELEEKIERMDTELKSLSLRYGDLCGKLHAARTAAAPALSESLLSELKKLELDRAVFEISLRDSEASQYGTDRIDFLFSSTGSNPVPVEKCASGGEISRIMLCLKASMAGFEGMPTMIFDEIDSGVSGSVAAAMGSKICSMGGHMQVFAITHLPQVAAKGKAHYLVSKSTNASGRAVSSIEKISAEARTREIARLLSGASLTPEALANAKVLLSE